MNDIERQDPEVWAAIAGEIDRQRNGLEMIASENYTSPAVMQAVGSVLTNKYAEGYPAHRYYGGCEFVDVAENLARDRLKQIFGAEHANVQPHSGAQANTAVYLSALAAGRRGAGARPGPRRTPDARHEAEHFGQALPLLQLRRAGRHAPDRLRPGGRLGPRAQAEDDRRRGQRLSARDSAREVRRDLPARCGAKLFVDMAHYAGLVAAKLHDDPVPVADYVSSTTHKTLRGPRGGLILCKEAYAKEIDRAVFPGIQGGPLMHVIAGKAVCFGEALTPGYKQYIRQVVDNAKTLAEVFLAGGMKLVSGGTDNHLILADVTPLGTTGRQAEEALDRCGITINKNMIPFDQRKPMDPSGVRIGTPALTTRGMGCDEMRSHRRLDPRGAPRPGRRRVGLPHPRPRVGTMPPVSRAGREQMV